MELNTNLTVDKTNRTHNTNSKDNIIKDLGGYCKIKKLNELNDKSKNDILTAIHKLDDKYHTNWSLFWEKNAYNASSIIL